MPELVAKRNSLLKEIEVNSAKRKSLLKEIELNSEMSGLESDAFTGTLDRKVPAFVQNIAMKQALQTGFETKKMHNVFGIRRQTFQESSSVLNSDRGPMLGSERILKQQTDKASN